MERKIAGAPPLADFQRGQRVMTREGYPGVIDDVHEGPADLTTYWVTLDAGQGGGQYAEGEIQPLAELSTARSANVDHTAADDYPELGSILSERPPPQISSLARNLAVSQIEAELTFPLKSEDEVMPSDISDAERQGYRDGVEDGKAGTTRNPRDFLDTDYRAGYDRGWARGVEVRAPGGGAELSFEEDRLLEESQTAGGDRLLASREAGFWGDFLEGDSSNPKYDGHRSYDWCRYRRDNHCFYSKNLNRPASEQMGYAVWEPEDRGRCPRKSWEAQQKCEIGLPGPNVPGGFSDATVPFSQGGQRGSVPSGLHRASLVETEPDLAFHITAAWRDVQAKAKKIRSEGKVRIIAAKDGVIVGQIQGSDHVYETEIMRVPGRKTVGAWACGCKWAHYSWGRSGPWKRYEGRMCSHALALNYEAQSRGMFGRDMTLDEKQPAWMDKGTNVYQYGDYSPDAGRYSSLSEDAIRPQHEVRHAADQYDSDAPVVAMVALMRSQGARYADVREFCDSLGVPALSIQREARSKVVEFAGKVRGRIMDLLLSNGIITEKASGREVSSRDVVYPDWDPRAGLDYREASLLMQHSGCGCGGRCTCKQASVEDEVRQRFEQENPSLGDGCEICGDSGHETDEHGPEHDDINRESSLEDEPEPALPTAYGEEDDEDALGDELSPEQQQKAASIISAMERFAQTGEGVNPLAHIGAPSPGGGDAEIAGAASQFLTKESLKDYSSAERQQIINEGEEEAGNLDRLDISGTHYEALERAGSSEEDAMWLMSGDPNG